MYLEPSSELKDMLQRIVEATKQPPLTPRQIHRWAERLVKDTMEWPSQDGESIK